MGRILLFLEKKVRESDTEGTRGKKKDTYVILVVIGIRLPLLCQYHDNSLCIRKLPEKFVQINSQYQTF
jgi:hypothetical protein